MVLETNLTRPFINRRITTKLPIIMRVIYRVVHTLAAGKIGDSPVKSLHYNKTTPAHHTKQGKKQLHNIKIIIIP